MESKRNKPKANKFPETALAFYIKLYCKQKGSSETKYQSNLIEATKSWLSLTEEEKQEVHESYKEKEHKFKLQCFDQLKNAEPFMKAKDQTGSNSVIQEPGEPIKEGRSQTETEHANQILNDEDMNLSNFGELVADIGPELDQEEHNETIREPIQHINEETPRTFLVEPLPPTLNRLAQVKLGSDGSLTESSLQQSNNLSSFFRRSVHSFFKTMSAICGDVFRSTSDKRLIRTSKDLFYMLNPAGGPESVSWTTLPISEKNQYRRAVSLLKTDYITKYKEYLESLTARELFDYYNKTIF